MSLCSSYSEVVFTALIGFMSVVIVFNFIELKIASFILCSELASLGSDGCEYGYHHALTAVFNNFLLK